MESIYSGFEKGNQYLPADKEDAFILLINIAEQDALKIFNHFLLIVSSMKKASEDQERKYKKYGL